MFIDHEKLRDSLTPDDIIKIVTALGAEDYEEYPTHIIFPTICHNELGNDMSMKLYYYFDNKIFHCYTECDASFNIYTLVKKVFALQGMNYGFYESLLVVLNTLNLDIYGFSSEESNYKSIRNRYRKKKREIQLPRYNPNVLQSFTPHCPPEWVAEGISPEVMALFGILYFYSQNKIIIPHYDIHEDLIGIRGRALNEHDLEADRKYMPVQVENVLYSHPLSYNLYGLNKTADNIRKTKQVILFEGEKSVLKLGSMTDINNSVATCGNSLNKVQVDLLMKTCQPREIVIAYDKEYSKGFTPESSAYLEKLCKLAKKYSNYCNFSIIFDMDNKLSEKDSPIDKGYPVFEYLMENRIAV